jgi:DNA-binding CsgD family transcriptional regulator
MAKSTTARAEGRFKQLCSLGLYGEAVIPALLAELHALVPSNGNDFHFADATGRDSAHVYNENTNCPASLYAEEFYGSRDREIKGLAYSEVSATQFGVHDAEAALGAEYETYCRGDLYNLICLPGGHGPRFLRLFIRDGKRRSTLGCVVLHPSIGARPWTEEQKRRLARLEPFFSYALTVRTENDEQLTDSGRSGVIIANPAGEPVHLSTEGHRLLFLATNPKVAPGVAVSRVPVLPEPLVRICRNLNRASSGDADAAAPVYHHRNVWGGFRFRAEWLDGNDPKSGLIAITVTHAEPLPLRLVRSAELLPLTARQAEVCVLMANGLSLEKIAERLGISRHTANEHGRWIYNKLDVHSRAELVNKLLGVGTVH